MPPKYVCDYCRSLLASLKAIYDEKKPRQRKEKKFGVNKKSRKVAGLCQECDKPPEPGRTRCRFHLDRINARCLRYKRMKYGKRPNGRPISDYSAKAIRKREKYRQDKKENPK